MKLQKLLATALAAGGLLLAAESARAATLSTLGTDSRLFLGFRADGEPGLNSPYVLSLGTVGSFSTVDGFSGILSLGNIYNDLVANFGLDWATRSDLSWGIFGSNGSSTSNIIFASRGRTDAGVQSTPWGILTDSELATAKGNINTVRFSLHGVTTTANSDFGVFQTAANAASYTQAIRPSSNPSAPDFGTWSSIEANFGNGASESVLDLYRFASGTTTYRGTFSIEDNGNITYSYTAPIPEPSSALLIASAGLVFAGLRRRRVAVAA